MTDIPTLHPAGICSPSGPSELILRIWIEDVMMRPIGSDSQPNMRGDLRRDLRGDLRGNARRGLAHEHLRSQRQHNTCNNTPHVRPPGVVRNARQAKHGYRGSDFWGVPVDFALLRNHILQERRSSKQGYSGNHRAQDPCLARFSRLLKSRAIETAQEK
jgi:hypothetical protein